MRKSYKRVAAAAAAVFMAVSMVGCSSKTSGEQVQETKQETEQGEEQEKELKVLTLKKENVDLFDDMLADYSKDHPGVTFKQTSGKQENLLTLISTNEVPDIMNVWPMNSLFREMMKEGVFMDLSGSEVLANVPENILEACRYDGKDYSVPISVNSYSMFYNTELFEKEGLTYPKTEDEFWTLCDTLKSRGIPAVTIGDKDIGLLQGYFARMLTGTASHDAKEITGAVASGEKSYSDYPEIVHFVESFLKLRDYTPTDSLGLAGADAREYFTNGEAAMYLGGTWNATSIKATNPDLKYASALFPEMNGVEPWASGEVDTAWAVAANTAYPEDAKQTVEFLGTVEEAQKYAEQDKAPCVITGVDSQVEALATINDAVASDQYIVSALTFWPAGMADEVAQALQQMFTSKDSAAFLDTFDQITRNYYSQQ